MKQEKIYYEKQHLFNNLCCMHAINNLLGYQVATQKGLNEICKSLSEEFINPHKHFLGGDYDANVLMLALQNLGCETKWLDSRNQQKMSFESLIYKVERLGYIINKQTSTNPLKKWIGLSGRHWVAVKCINGGEYIELDSKAESKQPIMITKISDYLKAEIKSGSHIIEVFLPGKEI